MLTDGFDSWIMTLTFDFLEFSQYNMDIKILHNDKLQYYLSSKPVNGVECMQFTKYFLGFK